MDENFAGQFLVDAIVCLAVPELKPNCLFVLFVATLLLDVVRCFSCLLMIACQCITAAMNHRATPLTNHEILS